MYAPAVRDTFHHMLEQLFRGKRMAEVVEALADKFGGDHNLSEPDRNKLFEIFAAHCVTSQYHREFDAEDLHAGQSRDLSIDAYAIIINDNVYTNAADVERVVTKARQLRVHFVLIQAKRSRRFEGRVFNSMVGDLRHIFSNEQLRFPAGPKAVNLRACITAIYRETGKFLDARAPRLSVWYASLGTFREGNHKARIADAVTDLRKARRFDAIEVRAAGAHELRDLYHDAESMGSATFPMDDRLELPKMPGVKKALFGLLPARVLIDQILLDKGAPRQYLFHDNLRDFLGANGQVNAAIRDTLLNSQHRNQFAVLNNGVTIVTPHMVDVGPNLHLRDPQVVNGCQTCNVLLAESANLDSSVMVGVRIIESTDTDVVDRIIRATNNQNVLRRDDQKARDGFQWLLEDYFRAQPLSRRLHYERRANQYSGITRSKIISRRHLTQAFAATWLREPHNVTSYQALVEDHAGQLFHPSHDPLPYYTAASGLYQLNWLLGRPSAADDRLPPTYRAARFHLLYGIKLYLLGEADLPGREDEIKLICDGMIKLLWDPASFRQLIATIRPAITASLPAGGDLPTEVRSEEFTKRFGEAVLALPRSSSAAA